MTRGYHTTVLDAAGLVRVFQQVAGRRFLGAVDGFGCVELIFEDPPQGGGNLVTIFTDGAQRGLVGFGGVSDPASYVNCAHGSETA